MQRERRARPAGFTLIELLVTLCIVGVLAAMLMFVATPGEATATRAEARRLAALLELALAETRASGAPIAWVPEPGAYAFLRKDEDGEWVRFPDDSPYRRRTLPAGTRLEHVRLDAQAVAPGMRVMIEPYGLGGAIEATLAGGGAQLTLRGGALRRIALEAQAPAREVGR